MPEHTETDAIRDALATEYEIIEELGRGGMAIVFRARERQLDREVALKVLPFSLAFDAQFVERFQREARTAARLEHPNIIPIYRVGRSGRVIYFVMKLLRGRSLSEQLAHRGRLPPGQIRSLLIQAAGALGYAHAHGIVHRDVKPDNIMFDELGHAVLTDFGIAKAASGTRLTGTGMSIGTPHYMSPEQARAQPLDGRSDLYALGVVAYQCLAGQVPFDGDDAFSIGYKHIMEALPVPALDTVEQRRLFAVIRRMMAKAPEDRYQSAAVLVRDLEAHLSPSSAGEDFAAAPTLALSPDEAAQPLGTVGSAAGSRFGIRTTPTTPVPHAPFPTRRRRGGGVLAAASLAVLLGGGGVGGYYIYRAFYAPQPGPPSLGIAIPQPAAPPDSAVAPDSARADSVARAEAARLAALPDTGWLVVRGAPRGARFFIGDVPHQDSVVPLDLNSYRLRVSAAGFKEFTDLVLIRKAESTFVDVQLTRLARAAVPAAAVPAAPQREPAPPERRDTAVAVQGQCEHPARPGYNAGQLCFDVPPELAGEDAALVPLDGSVIGRPRPVVVIVQVSADGRALRSLPGDRTPPDPSFMALALRHARGARYQPAIRAGRPVQAWWRFRFFPGSRRP